MIAVHFDPNPEGHVWELWGWQHEGCLDFRCRDCWGMRHYSMPECPYGVVSTPTLLLGKCWGGAPTRAVGWAKGVPS
jgi:hypothetical protein